MITYDEALSIIRREAARVELKTENVDLSALRNRVSAGRVVSPLSIPPFDNAAMDGFAMQSVDAQKKLNMKARIVAGDTAKSIEVFSGECCEIMTGAPLPKGADSIVPVEQAKMEGNVVSFSVSAHPGDHVRRAGSDFMAGVPVIEKGETLGVEHVLPLATLGIGKIEVYKKPKVAFIPTGREIADQPGQKLREGQIYNSNLPYAMAFLAEAGVEVLPQATIPDDPAQFKVTVKKLMGEGVNLILSSGAVSAGSHDFIRASLEEMGASILFHKVAIKPGKPVLFAKLPGGTLYLGLPGNPVSTAVGLRFFVKPLLTAMMHQRPEKTLHARAKTSLSKKAGLRMFLKARLETSAEGILTVELLEGQESYKTSPFLAMNGWAVIPEDAQVIDINDIIEVFPLGHFLEGD